MWSRRRWRYCGAQSEYRGKVVDNDDDEEKGDDDEEEKGGDEEEDVDDNSNDDHDGDDHNELLLYRYAPYVVFIASPCLQTIQVNTKHTKESSKQTKHTKEGLKWIKHTKRRSTSGKDKKTQKIRVDLESSLRKFWWICLNPSSASAEKHTSTPISYFGDTSQ